MLTLRIAELRKKNNMTQQELGELLSVSDRTVSKWENGTVLPDVTMLPKLAARFSVSVDALLGLVPLADDYRPSDSGCREYWAHRVEYLKRTRRAMWNEDYLRFLVREVWRLEHPVELLDCGCGCGAMGLLLLGLLPPGSRYVGVDFSEEMLAEARRLFAESGCSAEFVCADFWEWKSIRQYDMVLGQAVLRHVNGGDCFLKKMISHAKPGGLVVSMECNREFEADGLYIDGMDYAGLCTCSGLKKLWRTELAMQNRDYSIAMKIPHYMRKAGLHEVSCRMNDRVNFLCPEQEGYEEMLSDVIRADHWDDEKTENELEENIAYFMNHGMSRAEAEAYCAQQNGIVSWLKQRRGSATLTKFGGILISWGWKAE